MKRRGILGVFLVSGALLVSGINFSFAKDSVTNEEVIAPSEPGNVFYAADFATDIKNEPKYSEQKTKTFDSMSFNYTPQVYRGSSVKVAILDSGINYTHEDFGNIEGNSRTLEYDFTLEKWNEYTYSSNAPKINDTLGHGTNVASVVASQINGIGVAGIAPDVELYIYKVTNSSNGYEWGAIQTAIDDCIKRKIDVINMSFQAYENDVSYNGSTMGAVSGCSTILSSWLNRAYIAGITLVGAAGNYNTDKPSYPASNNHVISVGSLARGSTSEKAGFSNTSGIDLVAPGYVTTAEKGSTNAYKETQGTSFSAPIVTAAIALYKQKNPDATPDEIETALYASCDPIEGNPSWAGHGRLNIDKLLGLNENSPQSFIISNVDDTIELEVGEEFQLDYSILPTTFNEGIEYTTAMGDCISVSDTGLITALAEGEDFLSIYPKGYPTLCEEFDIVVNSKQIYDPMPESPIELSTVDLLTAPSGDNWTTNNLSTYCGSATANKNGSFSVTYSLASDFADLDFSRIESSTLTVIVGGGSNNGTGGITVSLPNNSSSTQTFPSKSSATELKKDGNYKKTFTFTNETAFDSITISAPAKFYLIDFSYKFEFTVKGSGTTTPTVSSVSIVNPTGSNQLTVGNTLSLSATVTGTNNPSQTVTWSSSNTSYATVSDSGLVTAKAAGNVTITATSTVNTSKTGTLDLTIVAAAATSYTVTFNANGGSLGSNPSTKTVSSGTSITLPTLTRTDYTFKGWDESSTSETASLNGGASYTVTKNVTLYAIWKKDSTSSDDFNGYYTGIDENSSTLLADLRTLNLEKRTNPISYNNLSSYYKYTDYDPNGATVNSDGQPYNERLLSFYSGGVITSSSSWNKEHVWPNSRGGGSDKGESGSPYVEDDLFMPRPTLTSENSDRGNSSFVENMAHPSNGWDPVTAFDTTYTSIRGECARIIFYCMTVNANLRIVDDANTDFAGVGGRVTIGKLSDLLRWNLENPVNDREIRRQSGGQYVQKNRNAFVDHPEYACKIWGNTNDTTREICSQEPTPQKTLTDLTYTGTPTKTVYNEGENFDSTGLTVTAHYDDDSTSTVTNSVSWTPKPLTYGTTSVTGTYQGKTITISGITVNRSQTTNIVITRDSLETNSAYAWTNWSQGGISGKAYYFGGTSGKIQMNSSKTGKALFSSSSNGKEIDSIIIKSDSGTPSFTVYGSNTAYTSTTTTNGTSIGSKSSSTSGVTWSFSGNNFKYFSIVLGGSSVAYISSIEVKFRNENTPKVDSITIPDEVEIDLKISNSYTFSPTIDAETGADTTVTWQSSETDVATISNSGVVTALKEGTTTITATCGGKNATCTLTVTDSTPKPVTSITVTNKPSFIEQGKYVDVSITVGPSNATNKNVTWSSTNSSVIEISNSSSTGARLTANGSVGSTSTITITAQDGSGVSTSFSVEITAVPIITYKLEPDKETVPYMSGTNHTVSVGVKLYKYTNNVKGEQVGSGSGNVDTSSLGNKEISYTYESQTYTTTVKVTNNGAVQKKSGSTTLVTYGSTKKLGPTSTTKATSGTNKGKVVEAIYDTENFTMKIEIGTSSTAVGNGSYDTIGDNFRLYTGQIVTFTPKNALAYVKFGIASPNITSSSNCSITSANSETTITPTDSTKQFVINVTGSFQPKASNIVFAIAGDDQILFTNNQQAEAWSDYFISLTGRRGIDGPCNESTFNGRKTKLQEIWDDVKAEYGYMVEGAKDAFCDTNASGTIAEAMQHYRYIVVTYNLEDFVVDGSNNAPKIVSNNPLTNLVDTTTIIIALIAVAGVAAIGGYFFYKKRKEQ